ncbi:ankyrin repeat-containing domain protein [Hypomontagnella monticulosa]|nr:ankyrin repeat-containing domain protein [Hypomontagnella monticulosa]
MERDHEQMVRALLLARINGSLESRDARGGTRLGYAAGWGNEEIVKLLLENGADAGSKDGRGYAPLIYAANRGHERVMALLLERGVDVEPQGRDGRTPLYFAEMHGYQGAVRMLLERGANPNIRDFYGSTPLSIAVRFGRETEVKFFLASKEVDISLKDNFGRTPLWWAEWRGYPRISELLLENAKTRGISISDVDLPCKAPWNYTSGPWGRFGNCDVCELTTWWGRDYYKCGLCQDGDFKICVDCFDIGARCLGDQHELIRQCNKYYRHFSRK